MKRRNRSRASSARSSRPRPSACLSGKPASSSMKAFRCRNRISSASWSRSSRNPAATFPRRSAICRVCCATASACRPRSGRCRWRPRRRRRSSARFLATLFAAVGAAATVLTLAMPLLARDDLHRRLKAVAIEREKLRQRERERLARGEKASLRQSPKQYMKTVVERFNLAKWLGQQEAREKLIQAGYRGQAAYITYLFFRMVAPVAILIFSLFYLFVVVDVEQPALIKIAVCLIAAYSGVHVPSLYLQNKITRRQLSIKRAFPDALDLLLICVESGMSVEAAFRKVAQEIGTQSIPLAEEFTLTTAELSYLQDRRQAYDNLAKRVNLEGVKAVCVALQQAERDGTPLGQPLRVMAQENRDMRMMEAEKKAAGLPPKLTVPMILFFLPVLFIVILGPAAIRVAEKNLLN